jgi:hypothetical protein
LQTLIVILCISSISYLVALLKMAMQRYKELLQTLIVILCISSISYLVALLKMAMQRTTGILLLVNVKLYEWDFASPHQDESSNCSHTLFSFSFWDSPYKHRFYSYTLDNWWARSKSEEPQSQNIFSTLQQIKILKALPCNIVIYDNFLIHSEPALVRHVCRNIEK